MYLADFYIPLGFMYEPTCTVLLLFISLARLRALDPVYADSLRSNDWYRLKRALEICLVSGRYHSKSGLVVANL